MKLTVRYVPPGGRVADGVVEQEIEVATQLEASYTCGSPMVPGDVVGLKPPVEYKDSLLCVGCQDWVTAPAAKRMAAQQAAKAERRAR